MQRPINPRLKKIMEEVSQNLIDEAFAYPSEILSNLIEESWSDEGESIWEAVAEVEKELLPPGEYQAGAFLNAMLCLISHAVRDGKIIVKTSADNDKVRNFDCISDTASNGIHFELEPGKRSHSVRIIVLELAE